MAEKLGNLGEIETLQRLLAIKRTDCYVNQKPITLTEEEFNRVEKVLEDFSYVLRNLYMYENTLRNDDFGALVDIIKEMKEKDY
ncbi:hypothetical protein FKN04_12645 [Bacillus glycinifermentans]|uniref:hypothetical protein n=1 Tax=Bacillus TaxID=1386 RepID=UPI0015821EAC|nr:MULTISPECIES: hypothetical protein [Bacillus]NUJ17424.1 hypothetical protein [Bacillus glycinifermentans]GIN66998.1 hypothetical protein J41TS2_24190 [Bacillus sonorensis]